MIGFSQKSHFILLYPVVISFCFLFESCTHQAEPISKIKLGGTYHIPIVSEISCLDPLCGEVYTWSIGSQILEGLVTFSKDGSQIIPLLAKRFEVKDSSIIFYLRKGVHFHNDPCFINGKGRIAVASDVKYSLERFFNSLKDSPNNNSPEYSISGLKDFFNGKTNHITGLEVINDLTFEIKTKKRFHVLKQLASHHFFVIPKEAVYYYGDDFKLHPVGTGPFRFSEFAANEKLVLVKNENYWDNKNGIKLPFLDAVEYIMYPLHA